MCVDKDFKSCINLILGLKNINSISFIPTSNPRSCDPNKLKEIALKELEKYDYAPEIHSYSTIDDLKELNESNLTIVCGSFFLMSEMKSKMGLFVERDSTQMNEVWIKK